MKIPLSLIKAFLEIDAPLEKIDEALTLLGIEVDAIINKEPTFSGVVAGKILSVRRHENAEKLSIAEVSDGKETFQVVCGAENCRETMVTAFAKVGSTLRDPDGKKRKIEKAKIRGVESYGMLSSEAELQLSDEDSGIMDLPPDIPLGTDLASYLWDPIFELSLTPNLGHCLSALGIARELSAAFQIPLHRHFFSPIAELPSISKKIKGNVKNPEACPRYICRLIEGIEVAPSPFWLQKQIKDAGMNPINNVVDITNYILIKLGQPLHAFDLDLIEGGEINVELSKKPLQFTGLDGVERTVPEKTLSISDAKKPIAIAGIMGADNSAVSMKTTKILLEAAFFNPMTVRVASKKMGLRTESAIRFEKGIDPNNVEAALAEAVDLILKICGGKLYADAIDLKSADFPPKKIVCRSTRVNKILGTKLSLTEIKEIFDRLGFKSHPHGVDTLHVDVPYYRFDISEEIDLVEEVARVYGYNNIEKGAALSSTSPLPSDPHYVFEKELRQKLIGLGLQEFLASDLIGPKLAEFALEILGPDISLLKAIHAKTEEYSILRPSLLPGLLEVAKGNFDRKNFSLASFELGRIHFLQKEKVVEIPMAAIMLTGKKDPSHWSHKEIETDFYDLKGYVEKLFESMKIPHLTFSHGNHISFHPARQANLMVEGIFVGSIGEIHPSLLSKFDIKQKILFAEIDIEHLLGLQKKNIRMQPLPQFPASERDLTLEIALNQMIEPIFKAIQELRLPLLEKFELLDIYHPENGKHKNATFRFTYRDLLKTISFEEVEREHAKLIHHIANLLAK